jgi:hypothetical protein
MPMDLTGQRFGRLVVESLTDDKPGLHWLCQCDCGNKCIRRTGALRDKHNTNPSCGCARAESIAKAAVAAWAVTTKFTHPHKLKLKWVLSNMIRRCHKPGSRRYERYGGRGIAVCEEWRNNHTSFFEWAIASGYQPGLTIERNNVDGNYCPDNCRWATPTEQNNNTSRNRRLTWNGRTKTVSEWAREFGVEPKAFQHRVDRNWSTSRIFTQPFRSRAA